MAELKTKETKASVTAFLNKIADPERRDDCFKVVEIMKAATKEEPRMWGPSIVGFGRYRYKYATGREGESLLIGFSPRKGDLTLYLNHPDESAELMKKLGKHKTGKWCLYIKKLADVDLKILRQLVRESIKRTGAQRVRG